MNRREKRSCSWKPASVEVKCPSARIINHHSFLINGDGFTLIELLVIISIVVLLMAVLLPTLHRVRKQARAVVCQANLRQWGTLIALSVNENNGELPKRPAKDDLREWAGWFGGGWDWGSGGGPGTYDRGKDIRCCPSATKPARPMGPMGTGPAPAIGGTFLAWGRYWPEGQGPVPGWNPYGSYGANHCVTHHWYYPNDEMRTRSWRTPDVPGTDRIPVYFDHTWPLVWPWKWDVPESEPEPPARDAIPTAIESTVYTSPCINRHDGGINAAFLDWSVRKVGLKELWTLKWNRQYSASGRWTKAGGVQPEDWPAWMRKFKDY